MLKKFVFTACMASLLLSIDVCAKNSKSPAIESAITEAANLTNVPPTILLALCWTESNYRRNLPEVKDGSTPSYGICQVKLETAQYMDRLYKHKTKASVVRLRNPFVNAFYAGKYLRHQFDRYGHNWKKAIAAYNMGSFRPKNPNKGYVNKVIFAFNERRINLPFALDYAVGID